MTDDAGARSVPNDDPDSYDALDERPTETLPVVPATPAHKLTVPLPDPPSAAPIAALAPPAAPAVAVAPGASRTQAARDWLRSGLASYRLRIVGWFVVLLASDYRHS